MKQHIHEYYGGVCLCGKKQPIYKNGKEVIVSDLSGVKIAYKPTQTRRRANSENQYSTQLLIDYLGIPVKEFARFARYVKKLGPANIHGIINQIKGTDKWCREVNGKPLNKIGYFINNWCKLKK